MYKLIMLMIWLVLLAKKVKSRRILKRMGIYLQTVTGLKVNVLSVYTVNVLSSEIILHSIALLSTF